MTDDVDERCTCAYLYLGLERTDVRDWRGHCPEHGYGTTWYVDRCRRDPRFARWTDPDRAPW